MNKTKNIPVSILLYIFLAGTAAGQFLFGEYRTGGFYLVIDRGIGVKLTF